MYSKTVTAEGISNSIARDDINADIELFTERKGIIDKDIKAHELE